MAVRRRSISFDADVLAQAERLSAERGGSFSAFVNDAVEHQLKIEGGRKLMEEDDERWGPNDMRRLLGSHATILPV
jgi:Arc/MetJ family transcription regulator